VIKERWFEVVEMGGTVRARGEPWSASERMCERRKVWEKRKIMMKGMPV
jgi:hypothetical protein